MHQKAQLTVCEKKICDDRAAGLSCKAIASKRGLTISTVKTHLDRAYKKNGVHSCLELQCLLQGRKCDECLASVAVQISRLAASCARSNSLGITTLRSAQHRLMSVRTCA
jgi:DNA-binding CsgD family transcriptional regulator